VKVVIGLGNPGPEYARSRHNAGFEAVRLVAERAGIVLSRRRFRVLVGEGVVAGERVLLGLPQTYMNLSGEGVAPLLRACAVTPDGLGVVHDDIDLPCGRLRVKQGGGHGGHNGLRSLMGYLATGEFTRFRIGVGRPDEGDEAVVDHVLGPFLPQERPLAEEGFERAAEAVLVWVEEGAAAAMNRYNRRPAGC